MTGNGRKVTVGLGDNLESKAASSDGRKTLSKSLIRTLFKARLSECIAARSHITLGQLQCFSDPCLAGKTDTLKPAPRAAVTRTRLQHRNSHLWPSALILESYTCHRSTLGTGHVSYWVINCSRCISESRGISDIQFYLGLWDCLLLARLSQLYAGK